MQNTITELKKFLQNGNSDDTFLQSQIKRFSVGNILWEDVKKLDLLDYCDCCDRIILQRIRDILFEKEIFKLIDSSVLKGPKLVCLKGIFLSYDLYHPKESRESFDIDLIVNFKDIGETFKVLGECGYKRAYCSTEKDTSMLEPDKDDLSLLLHKHIEFVKDVEFLNCIIPVIIEVHINFATPEYLQIDSGPILSRAVKIDFKGHDVWLLELHDRLIFLFIHYIENFSENIARVLMGKNVQIPKLQLLHDMALFIDKYTNEISWDTILTRTNEWGICNRLILLFKLIERMYPGRIPDRIVEKLRNNNIREDSFQEFLFKKLLEVDADYIFFKDLKAVLSGIFSLEMLKGQNIACKYSQDAICSENLEEFIIDEYSKNMPKGCHTYLSSGVKPKSSLECSAKGRISWCEDTFNISIRVYDDNLVFAENCIDFSMKAQDGIEVIFLTDAVSMHQFGLIPTKFNNDVIVNVVYCKNGSFLSKDSYSSKINVLNDGYEVYLSLPWKYLGIEVYAGLVLGIDIAINNCEKSASPRKTRLALSSGGTDWYNVTSFSKICLIMDVPPM